MPNNNSRNSDECQSDSDNDVNGIETLFAGFNRSVDSIGDDSYSDNSCNNEVHSNNSDNSNNNNDINEQVFSIDDNYSGHSVVVIFTHEVTRVITLVLIVTMRLAFTRATIPVIVRVIMLLTVIRVLLIAMITILVTMIRT